MSVSNLRAAIKTELESISSLSSVTVHDYRRRVNEWSDIETDFKVTDKIHTWIIKYLGSVQEYDEELEGFQAIRTFELWGVYSFNDDNASEKSFDNIVEDVENELASTRILVTGRNRVMEINTTMDEYMFAGILCNRCILTLRVKEALAYA